MLLLPLCGFRYAPSGAALASFTAERFERLQSEDRSIVLQFHNAGSDICLEQEKVLDKLTRSGDETMPVFLQVDVEASDALRQQFGAVSSTLLYFRGKTLIGRKNGLLSESEIRRFLREAVERSRGRPGLRPKRTSRPKR